MLLLGALVVQRHHVLQVVALTSLLCCLQISAVALLVESAAIRRLKPFFVIKVKSTSNVILETLRGAISIALSIDVLSFDSRNESSVSWNALVSNLMVWSINPSD